jgi:LPXTG-motif cell wall-anchored protein
MSIARRVTAQRLLGATAVALALTAAGATSAWAGDCPGGKGWGHGNHGGYKPGGDHSGPGQKPTQPIEACSFSLDGKAWTTSVKVDDQSLKPGTDGKVHVWVKAGQTDATCTVSLASYKTHGPTFATSGKQVFLDFDTVTVKGDNTDSLDIAVPDVGCFAQVDLYRGNTRFDGGEGAGHGPVPEGPNKPVIMDKLLASWNGGTKDCSAQPNPTPTETAPGGTTPTPTAPGTTAPGTTPPTSPSASATTSPASPSGSVSASASTSAPAAASASASPDTGGLAETGSSGTGITIGAAAALLAAGGGALLVGRRRKAAGRH